MGEGAWLVAFLVVRYPEASKYWKSEIGIGGASRLLPSHTTVRTGPYTAVRWIKRWRSFAPTPEALLEHFPKRLNRGIPLRERIRFKVRAGMEASMDGETVFGRSACARRWSGTGWRYYSGDCGATWSEYQLCRALP